MDIHQENIAIEVHDLTVSYDRRPVLWNIDFNIPQGAMVGIMGPNGSGKTTLLKSMMGLLPINSGYTKIFGRNLDDVRQLVSYMPQRGTVDWDFPASVLDVVLMGRYGKSSIFSRLTKQDKEIALDSLRKVDMLSFQDRQISQLSGGQQQRVFLARALAQQAKLYLMDEPFAGVDASTEAAIIEVLRDLKQQGNTVVVVHHDMQTAAEYFDWIALLNTRLIAAGPVEDVFVQKHLQEAFGGKLTMLASISELLNQQDMPVRENKKQ